MKRKEAEYENIPPTRHGKPLNINTMLITHSNPLLQRFWRFIHPVCKKNFGWIPEIQ
jgi:hypothetical protein